MQLQAYNEIIGFLNKIAKGENRVKLEFGIVYNIEIPEDVIEEKRLDELIGKRVGILNVGDGRYKIRRISNKKEKEV
ncbi:MAG: hypothetical protein BV457_00450 [Thermoplasmata archaeon M9B1D]|nr:MAG: hypothetical protein BV457_00450 [Thermoplasmata archaeon M9B1D]PNX51685.1 MAG: hypothetical protein BV456_02230 [Thermoplasmata archaeon M8B2D]